MKVQIPGAAHNRQGPPEVPRFFSRLVKQNERQMQRNDIEYPSVFDPVDSHVRLPASLRCQSQQCTEGKLFLSASPRNIRSKAMRQEILEPIRNHLRTD